jgi:phosphopantetheinyl transferase
MLLPHTVIAQAEWVTSQNPALWLTADEFDVYGTWRSEKRKAEWLAGRLAAKKLLWEEWGIEPRDWQIGRDGVAPSVIGCDLPNITLSLSHSSGLGAATFSDPRTEGSAGIDIQHIRPVHPGLCARVFTQYEREQIAGYFGAEDDTAGMLLLWALKEAAIKARRLAWERPLQSIEVQLGDPGGAVIIMAGEAAMTAQYERLGDWWVARAIKPH